MNPTPTHDAPADRSQEAIEPQQLACIDRGPDEQFRITWDYYSGWPFVGARIWSKGKDGSWYPDKRGVSIRLRELEQVRDAIDQAIGLAAEYRRNRDSQPRTHDSRQHRADRPKQAKPSRQRDADNSLFSEARTQEPPRSSPNGTDATADSKPWAQALGGLPLKFGPVDDNAEAPF